MRLDDFLLARAHEIDDDHEEQEKLFNLVADLRELESGVVERLAHLEAARFSDHPDYNPAWED
jgi:hypothetical protein